MTAPRFRATRWVAAGALLLVARGAAASSVPLGGQCEARVADDTRYRNPFADVTLQAAFTDPDGRRVAFWGFHDGDGQGGATGKVWRIRFMPDKPGTWSWQARFSDGTAGKAGTFECVAPGARPGPLRPDPANPRWFMSADGSRRHLHGYYYLDYFSDHDDAFRDATASLQADGYTLVMPMAYIRGRQTKGALRQPVQPTYAWRTDGDAVDFARFDLATWRRLDERIKWAADRGIALYTFDGFFPNIGKHVPKEREDLYIRYTLARHAAFWNVLWNVGFEVWEHYPYQRVREWAAKIRALDPWKHPVSWHDQGLRDKKYPHGVPEATYANLQKEFRNARPAFEFVLANDFAKPVFASETNWEQPDGTYDKPRNRTEVRRGIWGMSLAGAMTMYADWTANYDPARPESRLRLGDGKGRRDVVRANQFMSGLPWWTMAPCPNLVADGDDVCLGAPGRRYVVFSEEGRSIALDLPAGTYRGEWWNPLADAQPASELLATFTWSGGRKTFPAPQNRNSDEAGDWVLHLWRPAEPSANLARDKIVFASGLHDPEQHADRVVDGLTDGAANKGLGVKVPPGTTGFIGVDLAREHEVDRVIVHWYRHLEGVYAQRFRIELARQIAGPWETVFTERRGDGGVDDIFFVPRKARFVRVHVIEPGANRWNAADITELEVYGAGGAGTPHTQLSTTITARPLSATAIELAWTPVPAASGYVIRRDHHQIVAVLGAGATRLRDETGKDKSHLYELFAIDADGRVSYPPADGVFGPAHEGPVVSRHRPVAASSVTTRWAPPRNSFHPGKVVSSNPTLENRGWHAASNSDEWISVDLGRPCALDAVTATWDHYQGPPAEYRTEISLDARTWTKARDGAEPIEGDVAARFVRLYVSRGGAKGGINLSKLEVTGRPVAGALSQGRR